MKRAFGAIRFDVEGFIDERIGVKRGARGKHGRELVCDCPLCGKAERFYVNAASGAWVCYKCGEGGTPARLISVIDGVSLGEAKKILVRGAADRPVSSVEEIIRKRTDREPDAVEVRPDDGTGISLPPEFVPVWDPTDRTWRIPAYLTDRGIHARTAAVFGLGFCLSGRYRGRVILPARVDGVVRTFQGRLMYPGEPRYMGPESGATGEFLFGYDEAIGAETVLVHEGPFDVVNAHAKGFFAVATFGKVLHESQAIALRDIGCRRAIVIYDPTAKDGADNPANPTEAAITLSEVLDEVLVGFMPGENDPGDASGEEFDVAVNTARAPRLRDRFVRTQKRRKIRLV